MKNQTEKSLDQLLSLSRAEFMENVEDFISDELKEYQDIMDTQSQIDAIEEDNTMQYAYNNESPYIF